MTTTLLSRRAVLLAVGSGATGYLLTGCGGGGGSSGGGGLNNFTVYPSRAAPGAVVQLTGLSLTENDGASVLFGDVPAIIHSWDEAGGMRVLVPPFLPAGGTTHTPPAEPVAVTVQLGTGTPKPAQNAFTVEALVAAPGTTDTIIAEFAAFGGFFQDFLSKGILPLFADNPVLDSAALIQGAAFMAFYQDALIGPDNPNSLQALMNGTSTVAPGQKLPKELIDALLAQGPVLSGMSDLAQVLHDAIAEIAPEALVTRGRGRDLRSSFRSLGIDWTKVSEAKRIVLTLQVQKLLQAVTNSPGANLVNIIYTAGMIIVQAMAIAVQPELLPMIFLADVIIGLGGKVISVISSVMPGLISDFYVVVKGVNRHNNDTAVDIPVNTPTSLNVFVVTQSTGGVNFTLAGMGELVLSVLEVKVPRLKAYIARLKVEGNPLYDLFTARMISITDSLWNMAAGVSPPGEWMGTKSMNFPFFKYPPTNVNHSDVVDIQILSPNLLARGVNGDKSLYLKGIHGGTNAGYRAYMTTRSLASLLPSLADLVASQNDRTGAKASVKGTVSIQSASLDVGVN